ncbi:MAG: HEAT repeat domain-containing protein, partial [Planctomycetota bacterium]
AEEVNEEEIQNHIGKLGDPDEAENAEAALVRIGKPAVPSLVSALTRGEYPASFYAAVVLGTIGDPKAIAPLIEALKHDNSLVRKAASQSLADMTDQDLGTDYERWKSWHEEQG